MAAPTAAASSSDDPFHARSHAFMTWLLAQPGTTVHPSLRLADYRSRRAGRGVEATAPIPPYTDLFSIPRRSVLSVETSSLPSALPALFAATTTTDDDGEGEPLLSPWTALVLVLIYEFLRPDSRWKPYLAVLPGDFDTPMFWSADELRELTGCAVLDKIGRASADAEFRRVVVPVVQANRDVFFPRDGGQQQQMLGDGDIMALAHRMASTIMAYAFDIEKEDQKEKEVDEDGYATEDDDDALPKGMVPLADMLNADAVPNASLFYGKDALTMRSLRAIDAGDEVLNDYGQLPRSDLLRRYGYITRLYAAFDCVEIGLDGVIAAAQEVARLPQEELEARLAWLEDKEIAEDSFELVWSEDASSRGPDVPRGIVGVVSALLASGDDYKRAAKDAVAASHWPLTDAGHSHVQGVVEHILRARLSKYAADLASDEVLLRDSTVTGRRRMAIEVRHGEMRLLHGALGRLHADDDPDDERQSKRRRVA